MNKNTIVVTIIVIILALGAFFMMRGQTQAPTTEEKMEEVTEAPEAETEEVSKNVVDIKDFAFSPKTITIKAGESVTWTNKDSAGHTATADDGTSFDTGIIEQGDSEIVTFDKPGTYAYHCTPHPNMKAEVVVE